MANKMGQFEKAMDELEGILAKMNDGGTTLEESVALYAKAADLIAKSNAALAEASVKIAQIDEQIKELRDEE